MHELAEKYWRPRFDGRPDRDSRLTDIVDFMLHWVTAVVHGVVWTIAYSVESILLVRIGPEHARIVSSVVARKARHGRRTSGVPP